MKKTYKKPELWYEDFRLPQSIAAGCEGIANIAEGQCTVTISDPENGYDIVIFTAGVCEFTPPNPDDWVCYHAPHEGKNVFSS